MLTGQVFDIQRFSIHDGPGIRTTVFLKGCPLSCLWCHNPESRDTRPEIFFTPDRCVGCGFCVGACVHSGHHIENGIHSYDRSACIRCGACTRECYPQALEVTGKEMTVEQVLAEVIKDQPFYENSGGGLTLSGGEPMMQFEFTRAMLQAAKASGLHTCMETSGYAITERMLAVQPLIDLFLYDIKETDPAKHRQYTGVDNDRILANLRALHAAGCAIFLRLPIVPGLNDRPDHFDNAAQLTRELPNLRGVEIMPYHRLGISKQTRLGTSAESILDIPAPAAATVGQWVVSMRQRGVQVSMPDAIWPVTPAPSIIPQA